MELYPLGREAVEGRCVDAGIAVSADEGVAMVVAEEQEDVRAVNRGNLTQSSRGTEQDQNSAKVLELRKKHEWLLCSRLNILLRERISPKPL
jgi:hypothetical protein